MAIHVEDCQSAPQATAHGVAAALRKLIDVRKFSASIPKKSKNIGMRNDDSGVTPTHQHQAWGGLSTDGGTSYGRRKAGSEAPTEADAIQ